MNAIGYAAIVMSLASATAGFAGAADDEAAIRALEDRFVAAFDLATGKPDLASKP